MLVLSRKLQQSIVIGDGIRITVLSVVGTRVKLGIEADADIPVMREELAVGHGGCEESHSSRELAGVAR